MKKTLILAPHPDDDVLSFGGYIIDELAKGNAIRLIVFAVGGPCSNVDTQTRIDELTNVMEFLGVTDFKIYSEDTDGVLGKEIPIHNIVGFIDKEMNDYKPDCIMSCYPSTHQDHLTVHEAFSASMRLRDGFMPNCVALGEYPFILPALELPNGGKWYHPLSEETFKKKCKAFELYKSQLRPSPSPLGLDGVEVLARTRGLECGHKYAELFYLQKIVY